jgi:predicted aldo/keto reductase-like oxidoreductase
MHKHIKRILSEQTSTSTKNTNKKGIKTAGPFSIDIRKGMQRMKYNMLGNSGLRVSEVGLGCEHLEGKDYETVESVVQAALECGINILDVFMSEPQVRSNIGRALKGNREKVILQGHIGAAYVDGQYKRTRDLPEARHFFEDFLSRIGTDYVDIGMIHFVDSDEDYRSVFETDIIKYAVELKKKGVIKAIGMSSHAPAVALKAVRTGLIDVLMFSINPAFDLLPNDTVLDDMFVMDTYKNTSLYGMDPVRAELYSACEQMGVGITVMKTLSGGILLNGEISPFGQAMTVHQCMHYALTRPAVGSVLIGCRTREEVLHAAAYSDQPESAKDYTSILSATPKYSNTGQCMYCNHCLPCPSSIDIASVTKYLDLASVSDRSSGTVPPSVMEHYRSLSANAENCIECGSCEPNCPFGVQIIENMRRAREIFR